MSIEEHLNLIFIRPILIGFIFGLIYFLVIQTFKGNSNKTSIKRSILFSFVALAIIPVSYYFFEESWNAVSALSSMKTNYVFTLSCSFICVVTSSMFFRSFRFWDFSSLNCFQLLNRLEIPFLADLNFYWFFLKAWFFALYFDSTSSLVLQILVGLLMSLSISHMIKHFQYLISQSN